MAISGQAKELLNNLNVEEMWKHLTYLCGFERASGTQGEYKAAEYIAQVLRSYGIDVNVYNFKVYLSYPVSGRLSVPGMGNVAAKTRAFSESTPEEGVSGEVVYVEGGADMFTDTETVERLRQVDLRGKIVLSQGGGRDNMLLARRLGAVGYIHMWPSDEDVIHEGIVTPVWGTPTPENFDTLPGIPVISIKRNDGLALKAMAEKAPVKVKMHTLVETGWREVFLPEAVIPGQTEEYVLIAGHLDSWHIGATDNATGNVACMELARVFHEKRATLRRGVRVCWWPGHSTGRYAGSTWYCDKFWQDLHDNCVAYINIDSPGVLGAYDYSQVTSVAEDDALAAWATYEVTGQKPEPERPSRAGDQSFWGPGISSLFMLISNRPKGQRAQVGGSGMGWWWHTEEDTLDKCEKGVLLSDVKVYGLAAHELCTQELLPLQVSMQAAELSGEMDKLARACAADIDFTAAKEALASLAATAADFDNALKAPEIHGKGRIESANRAMMKAIKILTPVRYSPVGPQEHGPATPLSTIPQLKDAPRLSKLAKDSDEYGFLKTSMQRRQNSIVASARQAQAALAGWLRGI
jgi:N-acetylated-alpha-linked acidic dipeptidase